MAEALAVIGIVANIAQVVEFGSKILRRLGEFQSSVQEVPKSFQHIKAELPVLLEALKQTNDAAQSGSLSDESEAALLPAIEECRGQVELLDSILLRALPVSGDSRARRSRKAIWMSVRYDGKVEKITATIRNYVQTLTYYHAAASSTLTHKQLPLVLPKPIACSTVPFRRDPDFVDSGILDELQARCSKPASRTALVGLGGIGKSQLAIEYAYQVRTRDPNVWVFWVHVGSATRFEDGYRRIAEVMKIPGADALGADVMKAVYAWLCDENSGRWVMIIDNADDSDVFTASTQSGASRSNAEPISVETQQPLADMIPQTANGSVLVTSRNRVAALRLVGSSSDIVNVKPMEETHALLLLDKKLQGSYSRDEALELIYALDCMPLAISQAAAYINERAPRITVTKYLQMVQGSDADRLSLLKKDLGDSRRDGRASNSIITTWQISFQHLSEKHPSAAGLLSFMCLFDRQAIPEYLLNNEFVHYSTTDTSFEDDLYLLISYSLVSTSTDGDFFEMHRLVQFSTRNWLDIQGESGRLKSHYLLIIDVCLPRGDPEHWEQCQTVLPHAEMILNYRPETNPDLSRWTWILFKIGWYCRERGKYEKAERLELISLQAREQELGKDHIDTFTSMCNLALTYRFQGRYMEAVKLNREAIEIGTRLVGPEHPDILNAMANLALTYNDLGALKESEVLNTRAIEIRKRVLGEEHSDTLTSMNNLALTYNHSGRVLEAEELNTQVAEVRKRVFGSEHPSTLISLNNLAVTKQNLSKYEEAEVILSSLIEVSKRVLGPEHPETLRTMANLAFNFKLQGRIPDALTLLEKCCDTRSQVIGVEHPDTQDSLRLLEEWKKEGG